jgi:hypothetical protein
MTEQPPIEQPAETSAGSVQAAASEEYLRRSIGTACGIFGARIRAKVAALKDKTAGTSLSGSGGIEGRAGSQFREPAP